MSKFPKSSGALFPNHQKQKQNHPDFRGNIEITGDQIRYLIEMQRRGLEPKLQVSGWWRNAAKTGQQYISMEGEAYMKEEGSQQAPQYAPPAPPQVAPQYQQAPQYAPQAPVPPAPPQHAQPVPPAPQAPFVPHEDDIPF